MYPIELLDPALQPPQQPDRASRFSNYFDDLSICPQYELFIPAPTHLPKDEALQYHLTTRNFFAWMYNRPLVGDRLGQAFIRLQARMDQYRQNTKNNQNELLAYFEDQGYLDFRHCPDHALAVLQYAEHHQMRDLWTDAFVHCSGMHDELDASCEFEVCLPNASLSQWFVNVHPECIASHSSAHNSSSYRNGYPPGTCWQILGRLLRRRGTWK